ncbi:unnamed protein product, partial [Oppiella nova]
EDLANGHLKALDKISDKGWHGFNAINLGTGRGYTVLEIIKAFESANGIKIPYKIVDRRPGDVTALYADSQLALEKLEWRAVRSLQEMCASAWKWQSNHPNGYNTKK